MHVFLVIAHLILLGLRSQRTEEHVMVPIGHYTTMLSMGLSTILQTFAIVSQFDSNNYSSSELFGKTDIPSCTHICNAVDIHAS